MAQPQLLVVNGDSNTWGAEHAEPRTTAWPSVLGARLGIPVVNLASPGSSNQRIVRTTVESLPDACDQHGVAPGDVLFIAMWSLPNRREYWGSTPEPAHDGESPDGNWRRIGPWGIELGWVASTAWFEHLQDDRGDIEDFFCASVLLESWLEWFGCRFALCSAYGFLGDVRREQFDVYLIQMREERYFRGVQGLWRSPFHVLVKHLRDRGPGGHKLAESHRHFTDEHLLPWLRHTGLAEPS